MYVPPQNTKFQTYGQQLTHTIQPQPWLEYDTIAQHRRSDSKDQGMNVFFIVNHVDTVCSIYLYP